MPPSPLLLASLLLACQDLRAFVIGAIPLSYPTDALPPEALVASFEAVDPAGQRIAIDLQPVVSGLAEITDIQFPPGDGSRMLVLRKTGEIHRVEVATGRQERVHRLEVPTRSEQGLLGLAFHPRWPQDDRVFLNTTAIVNGADHTRISAWRADPATLSLSGEQILLEVAQPYPNHNAGQLAFGPDGKLYVGLGDGGAANDPHGHGQDRETLLGSMLRLDVDGALPPVPETFAIGLRNPWRYSFTPDGRLVVADVGQNTWEEVSLVPEGANLGWNLREGRHCFPPDVTGCPTEGLVDPVFEYGRDAGFSVTGGYVVTGSGVPALTGKYLVGDFGTGRMWALELPAEPGGDARAWGLGRWPIQISTFGRDPAGEVYVADFGRGTVYRIVGGGNQPGSTSR